MSAGDDISVDTHICIVPILKEPQPSQNNDYRPVDLPSDEISGMTSAPAHLHRNITVSRSSSVCLQAKQEYRRCNSHTCSPRSETPGYTQNLSPYSLFGLFKHVQHYPATYTTPETESHACESIFAQVDLGLQSANSGLRSTIPFLIPPQKQWRPLGLCEFTSTVLSVHK